MLRTLRIPIGWTELARRTVRESLADNLLGMAAELAYYFFLALFPALLFLVALVSFIPIENLLDTITAALARVAPSEVLSIIQEQILNIARQERGGLLTLGVLGAIWSTSSGMTAIIDTLNRAYGVTESRSLVKVRLRAMALTVALAAFVVASTVLVLAGPALAEQVAAWFNLGSVFEWTWKIAQWPLIFALVALAIALIYYYAPDVEQKWIWITPGSVVATVLWLLISLGFRLYLTNFGSYNATYGAIGGVIVLMLWFYLSGLAVLLGAELNSELEHASPYGKDPGERTLSDKPEIGETPAGAAAAGGAPAAAPAPAYAFAGNCEVDRELPPAAPAPAPPLRGRDWVLGGVFLGQAIVMAYARLRGRFERVRTP